MGTLNDLSILLIYLLILLVNFLKNGTLMDRLCFTDYEIVLRKMYVFWYFRMLGDEKIV
jgi:hypothetical protein